MTEIQQRTYRWHAVYRDGRELDEFDESRPDGRGPGEALAGGTLASLSLIDVQGGPSHHVIIPQDAEPVFVWRNTVVAMGPDVGADAIRVCVMGWKRGEQGCYLFVFPNGMVLVSEDFNAV